MMCRFFLMYGQSVDRFVPIDFSKDPRGALPLAINMDGNIYIKINDNWYAHVQPTIL